MKAIPGYDTHTSVGPITRNRYDERGQSINDVIAVLQIYKARGIRHVQITDGYFAYAFNIREQETPNYDAPCTVLLKPVNRHPDADGITREVSGVAFQERQAGDR